MAERNGPTALTPVDRCSYARCMTTKVLLCSVALSHGWLAACGGTDDTDGNDAGLEACSPASLAVDLRQGQYEDISSEVQEAVYAVIGGEGVSLDPVITAPGTYAEVHVVEASDTEDYANCLMGLEVVERYPIENARVTATTSDGNADTVATIGWDLAAGETGGSIEIYTSAAGTGIVGSDLAATLPTASGTFELAPFSADGIRAYVVLLDAGGGWIGGAPPIEVPAAN